MGEVWHARDTRQNREAAIKFSQAQFSDRFQPRLFDELRRKVRVGK